MSKESNADNGRRSNSRHPWEPMSVTYVGDMQELVLGGEGKLSVVGGDPGDARKQSIEQ